MDARHFDALTKRLTEPQSRRGLLGGAFGVLTGILGAQQGQAKSKRLQKGSTRGQANASAKKCRKTGHPCNEKQTCCPGLGCVASDRGSARRCAPCSFEGASCTGDEACCSGVCCINEGIDPVGVCCASRDHCCGGDCCIEGEVCDFRFLMCVRCQTEEDFCQVPFCNCCPGLEIRCDEAGCRCVPA
jgi:hypothetical protein